MMRKVFEILENDARLTPAQVATMAGVSEAEVKKVIAEAEKEKVIVKYKTMINWEKAGDDRVWAIIEVKMQPRRMLVSMLWPSASIVFRRSARSIWSPERMTWRCMWSARRCGGWPVRLPEAGSAGGSPGHSHPFPVEALQRRRRDPSSRRRGQAPAAKLGI